MIKATKFIKILKDIFSKKRAMIQKGDIANEYMVKIKAFQLSRSKEEILDELQNVKSELFAKKEECKQLQNQRDEAIALLKELIYEVKISQVVINWENILGSGNRKDDEV